MTVSENQKFEFPDELFAEEEFDRLVSFSKTLGETVSTDTIREANDNDELLPQSFGNFKLTRLLGQGETGRVYLARQTGMQQPVAVKKIHTKVFANVDSTGIDKLIRRFRKQSRAAAVVDHSNVVATFDVGEIDGQYFYSMKYVSGNCLSKLILANTLSNREAAETVKAVAESLHRLHTAGIFHHELKTSNILLDTDRRPHILGLGVATLRSRDPSKQDELPRDFGFLAPEFVVGSTSINPAAEVWSLGVILYHCLVGEPPFSCSGDRAETLRRLLEENPEPPRKRNQKVAADLETICLKCLRKNSANRYVSAAALAEDLERFLDYQPIKASPTGLLERGWNRIRRRPS